MSTVPWVYVWFCWRQLLFFPSQFGWWCTDISFWNCWAVFCDGDKAWDKYLSSLWNSFIILIWFRPLNIIIGFYAYIGLYFEGYLSKRVFIRDNFLDDDAEIVLQLLWAVLWMELKFFWTIIWAVLKLFIILLWLWCLWTLFLLFFELFMEF